MALTITEALAEIKTISKRVEKKVAFINAFLYRQEGVKDPLEKDGGSAKKIDEENQAINDLLRRLVDLRIGILQANLTTKIKVGDLEMSIAEWLVWRREAAPLRRKYLGDTNGALQNLRRQAMSKGSQVVAQATADTRPIDFIVNISESDLATQIENFEKIMGDLDGQLSLKNATTIVKE